MSTSFSLKESLELTDHDNNGVGKLLKAWDNRIVFPLSKLPERYLRKRLSVHLHGRLEIAQGCFGFCLEIIHERTERHRAGLNKYPWKDDHKLPMFIKFVHLMDNRKGIIERVGSLVRLKPLNNCLNPAGESLYFSVVSGKFIFANRFLVENRKPNSRGIGTPLGLARQSPRNMIQTRSQVVDDLSAENVESEWDGPIQVVVNNLLPHFAVLMRDDGVEALVEKDVDLPIEITDTLIGPFGLLVDPL